MGTISKVGVIGAGTMGNGIAQTCAVAGLDVAMLDVAPAAIERGVNAISGSLDRLVKKQTLKPEEKSAVLGRIRGTTDYSALNDRDLVIEAATENLDLKLKILKDVAGRVGAQALIASNTSSISITQMAAVLPRPDAFAGMHFFNPVPLMPLVEVVRGLQTSDATAESIQAFATRLGKTPIVTKSSPGFIVNRVLIPMINEAIFALQEGLGTAKEIDDALKLGASHPIGPLALADMIGLDVVLAVVDVLNRDFNDPKYRPALLLREMVAAGCLGRKSGRGFYAYG
jgi:3-hydroxybutyryl-CoA dehydrogenase